MVLIALAAFGGGILGALLGFFDAHEAFDWRKFGKSVIVAILAGIGFALAYPFVDGIGIRDILLAIASGAGADSVVNRLTGTLKPHA